MSTSTWSLLKLAPEAGGLIPRNHDAASKRSNDLAALGKTIEKELDLPWSTTWDRLGEPLTGLLDIPLDEVLLSAWIRYSELVKLSGKSRKAPDKIFEQEIGKQRIESVHRPYLEILVNGEPRWKLELKVTLRLELQAFSVRIRDGLVLSVTPGILKGSIAVAYGPEELGRADFGPARLPGTLDFEPPIPLGATRQEAAPTPTQSSVAPVTVELRSAASAETSTKRGKIRRRFGQFLFFSGLVLLAFWFGMPWLEGWLPAVMRILHDFVVQLLR